MLAQAKEKLQAHALEASLASLGIALPAWLLLAESSLVPYVSQLSPSWVIRSTALLLVVALWLSALLIFFRPKLQFDPRLGIYRDRKTGLYYCPSCHIKKLRSPLKEGPRGWFCSVKDCRQSYINPDHKAPSAGVHHSAGRNSWMSR